jgi:hypothetical protein
MMPMSAFAMSGIVSQGASIRRMGEAGSAFGGEDGSAEEGARLR